MSEYCEHGQSTLSTAMIPPVADEPPPPPWAAPTDPAPRPDGVRTWDELRSSGLLWLINRVVFHPRGWAFALSLRDGDVVGWNLLGDGREVWHFEGAEDAHFADVAKTLAPLDPTP